MRISSDFKCTEILCRAVFNPPGIKYRKDKLTSACFKIKENDGISVDRSLDRDKESILEEFYLRIPKKNFFAFILIKVRTCNFKQRCDLDPLIIKYEPIKEDGDVPENIYHTNLYRYYNNKNDKSSTLTDGQTKAMMRNCEKIII